MSYAFIPYIVILYLMIRIGILYGRKIPLIFLGLLVIGRLIVPVALGPLVSPSTSLFSQLFSP